MIEVTEYKIASGEFGLFWGFADEETFQLNKKDGYGYLAGRYNSKTQYVNQGFVVNRPAFTLSADKQSIAADGQDVITISGLPEGVCQVMLWGAVVDSWEQEGDIQLTANIPGAYQLRISQWPYQDQEISFDAA
jgi:hypothetical protein